MVGLKCVCVCAETIHNWMANCLPIWWCCHGPLFSTTSLPSPEGTGKDLHSALCCAHTCTYTCPLLCGCGCGSSAGPPVTPEQLVHMHFQLTAGHLACMQRAGLACDPRTDVRMYIRTYGMWYSRASCLQTRVDDSGGRG